MSKVMIALASLLVGASVGFLGGNQAPLLAQSPTPLPPGFISRPNAIPVVPEIKAHLKHINQQGLRQQLDGMDISDSEFKDMIWEYSGGAFSLNNVTVSTPIQVHFSGAAANTLALLDFLQKAAGTKNEDKRVLNSTTLKIVRDSNSTITVVLESPYK